MHLKELQGQFLTHSLCLEFLVKLFASLITMIVASSKFIGFLHIYRRRAQKL